MAAAPTWVPADQAVRDRIRTDLDSNLCVEAGAGTGKTTVLVTRIVELLKRGRASIDEIAVITFTEKAAAELAARVRDELEKAFADPATGAEERERVRDAVLGLHRSRIETIHSFAANLLRERPVEAGLDPEFDVLEGLAGGLAFEEAYEEWVERLFGEQGEETKLLRRVLNRGFDLRQVRGAIDEVHAHRYALPLEPFSQVVRADPDAYVREVERICAELERCAASCHDHEDPGFLQSETIRLFRDELHEAARADREQIVRVILQRFPNVSQKGRQASFGDPQHCRDMKTAFGQLREDTEKTQEALKAEALADFLPLAEEFVMEYERKRRADGRADFDDLLLWARDLLRDKPEVRAYFQRRFRCVFVDEFQDTDLVQAELIIHICSDGDGKLRPGSLFVVGDPKQSIYRFRRADMATYDAVKHGPLAGGVVKLTQNFRSLKGVIDWVNGAFDKIFVEQEGVQPPNIRLDATPSKLRLERSPVVVLHGGKVPKQRDYRIAEGRAVASLIKRAVEEERWPVRDLRSGEVRAARYGDVAVLVPTRTDIELHEDAFKEAGLPFRYEGSRRFYERQEVKELAACLQAIDDPTDRLNLVTALRSSAFACSDEDLFLFVADGGRFDYFKKAPGGHETVRAALTVLRELHGDRRSFSLPELVHRVISRTHWMELTMTIGQGEQAAANLLKVVDQARAFAGAGGGGLRAFARWLETGRDPEVDEEEASAMEETDDVVRLLTIHHAKGLEFPIVALANMNAQPPSQRYTFFDRESGRLHVDTIGKYRTPGFGDAWEHEAGHSTAERLRLLYVACTRARDHLIVPLIETDWRGVQGMLKDLEPFLTEEHGCYSVDPTLLAPTGNGDVDGKVAKPSKDEIRDALVAREKWIEERDGILAEASRGLAVDAATGASLDEPESNDRPSTDRKEQKDRIWARRSKAARIGEALHSVMEKVDLPDAKSLEPLARAVCTEAGVPDCVEEVIDMARNCLASPVFQRAITSHSYSRELSFANPGESGVVTGRIDLVFRSGPDLVAIDYKTDQVTRQLSTVIDVYRDQADAYARGLSRSTGLPVRQIVLLFPRLGISQALSYP